MQQNSLPPVLYQEGPYLQHQWVAVGNLEIRRGAGTSGSATLFLDRRICDQPRRLHLE